MINEGRGYDIAHMCANFSDHNTIQVAVSVIRQCHLTWFAHSTLNGPV